MCWPPSSEVSGMTPELTSRFERRGILPLSWQSTALLLLAASLLIACLLLVAANTRYVLAPILAALFTALTFFLIVTERRGNLPLDDIGMITVLAIVCYTVLPPLQFLLSGMEYTNESAIPLYALNPSAEDLGRLTWWYVIYLLGFAIGYLIFDSRGKFSERPVTSPGQVTI